MTPRLGERAGARFNRFEDFQVGREFRHRFARTVTEAEAIEFATQWLQFEPALLDREYARYLGHPDLMVSSQLVYTIVFGLTVEDLSEAGGVLLGADRIRFHAAVHPGDTLRARSTVIAARPSSKSPTSGVVQWATTGFTDRTGPVITFTRSNLVPRSVQEATL
jgi:itaconyl-CoA hydratase